MENKFRARENLTKRLVIEIHTLEYLITRLDKNDLIIKNLCQGIIDKLEDLDFGLLYDQPHELIQLLHDFNMIHEEHQLGLIVDGRLSYWKVLDRYKK